METNKVYLCPVCNSQLEYFTECKHTWYRRMTKYGRITKQSHKINDGPVGIEGVSCSNPKCNYRQTLADMELSNRDEFLAIFMQNSL